MSKEAMKLALEALQKIYIAPEHEEYIRVWWPACEQAITALREALANEALDKKAENARELGLDYEPAQQEPVAWINWCAATGKQSVSFECESELASQPLYEGITQNTQYHYSKFHSWFDSELHRQKYTKDHPAYLAAQEAWNAANDAAQHRINRLNAEIEAWKVRFKIAEDALVKLNGMEQKPVAWKLVPTKPTEEMLKAMDECSKEGYDERLYAGHAASVYMAAVDAAPTPPAQRTWVGLSDEEIEQGCKESWVTEQAWQSAVWWAEAKLKEKNT